MFCSPLRALEQECAVRQAPPSPLGLRNGVLILGVVRVLEVFEPEDACGPLTSKAPLVMSVSLFLRLVNHIMRLGSHVPRRMACCVTRLQRYIARRVARFQRCCFHLLGYLGVGRPGG